MHGNVHLCDHGFESGCPVSLRLVLQRPESKEE